MHKHILLLLSLLLIQIHAEEFQDINPTPTNIMITSQENAQPCSSPSQAKESFDDNFRYGCFCGKQYPKIEHYSNKKYKILDKEEREELIVKYYAIEAYDDIDKICQAHDICYLYHGKEAQVCNDTFYTELKFIQKSFKKKEQSRNSKEHRCRLLASDMSAVFKSIFGMGEDIAFTRMGLFTMMTPIHLASKLMQKTAQKINSTEDYPLKNEKCLLEE